MRKLKAKIVCAVTAFMAMLNFAALNAYAAGDVASAVEGIAYDPSEEFDIHY